MLSEKPSFKPGVNSAFSSGINVERKSKSDTVSRTRPPSVFLPASGIPSASPLSPEGLSLLLSPILNSDSKLVSVVLIGSGDVSLKTQPSQSLSFDYYQKKLVLRKILH